MHLRIFAFIITHRTKIANTSPCKFIDFMLYLPAVIRMNKKVISAISLLMATVLWGSAFASQNLAMNYMKPFAFQAGRCLIAVIGMMPVIAIADKFNKDGSNFWKRWADPILWKAGILCGIPLFLACNLQQIALVDTDAGKAGFLTAMYIVFVPVLGLLRKQKMGLNIPISVLIATIGLYFLSCTEGFKISTGDALLLGCAVMFAVQITFIDKFAKEQDTLRLNAIQGLVCAILSAAVMLITEPLPTWDAIAKCTIPLLHVGFLSMGVAYALQIIGQKNMEPAGASLIMSLESVFAAIFGIIILQQWMSKREVIGCILLFTAVILSQIPIRYKKKVHP